MEWWHNICGTCSNPDHCCVAPLRKRRKGSGDREGEEKEEFEIYCRRVTEEEKDERKKEKIRSSHAGKKSLWKKRPINKNKRPASGCSHRESNRWAHHVSAWIQRLKSSPVAAAQHDKGRPSALDAEFEIGTQVPRRYFASEDDSYPIKNPVVKSDIFIFILFQRRTFLLPKFYPKSLHFFEDDSHIPPSSIRPRRNSEPNVFSLDSSYLIHSCDKKTIFEYENSSYPSQFTSHSLLQSSRDPFIPAKDKGTEERSVKDKLKEKFSWFFQKPKKRKLDETEVNESTSILPSKSRHTLPESVRFSTYSSTSSRPLLGQEILPSLPSQSLGLESGTKKEARRQRSDSYPSKSQKSYFLTKQYSSQTSLKYLSDKKTQRIENDTLPELEKLSDIERIETFPQSSSGDFLLNTESKADSSETIESQNSLSLKLKLFQDNIGKLADKIKNKYLTNKSSSFHNSQEECFSRDVPNYLKEGEIINKDREDIDTQKEEKPSQQIINVNKESVSDSESCAKSPFYSNLRFDSIARRLRKISRRRSEETGNESTEEPLPKHLRSMSLPDDSRGFHRDNSYPVRPQRKKYRMKRALELEPSDDETSVDGSPNNKYEKKNFGSRRDLQFCRREFLSSMVSLSSTEEEDDEGVREKTERKKESLLHDCEENHKTEDNVFMENSEVNSDKILSPLYEISEDNFVNDNEPNVNLSNLISKNNVIDHSVMEICSGTQNEQDELFVSSQTDQFKETVSKDTVKNEDVVDNTKLSDKYCDNLPSVIEHFNKGEVINESESYTFTSTGEVRDTPVSAKVSDLSDTFEIVNENVHKTAAVPENENFLETVLRDIVTEIKTEVKEEEINFSDKESDCKIKEESEGDDLLSCKSNNIPVDTSERKYEEESLSEYFIDGKLDIIEVNVETNLETSFSPSEEKSDRECLDGNYTEGKFSIGKSETDLEVQISFYPEGSDRDENLAISLTTENYDIKEKESDKNDFIALLNYRSMSKSESQPQIFVTPADVSEKIVERKEIIKSEKAFSFAEAINHPSFRTERSIPVSSGGIKGTASSVESQHGSSTIFSELESHSPSLIDNFNVSPNLSPRINSPLSGGGVSDIFPTTPKSPITVQEWIDSLPTNVNEQRDDETYEDEWREEPSSESKDHPEISRTNETTTKEEGVFLGEEAFDLNSSTSPTPLIENEKEKLPTNSKPPQSKRGPPPLTLKDIKRSVSKDESEESPVSHRIETPCKRTLYAETRDKQTSFQSETSVLSGLSHQSVSSIESLLESRQLDPVDILLNLGFGSTEEEEGISRIPPRFLKPSKVPGNDISVFLRQEDNLSDLADSSDWAVPNLSTQVFRRNSLKSCSPLFTNLMENVREKQNRFLSRARTRSDLSSVSSNESRRFPSRFASVAKGLGKQASFARRLTSKVAQNKESANNAENVRRSVLLPENRRFLDLQGQRSPEAPKKRLIIGTDSFSLSNSGEIIDSDEESKSYKDTARISEKEDIEINTQKHKDSIASVVSSTSIDSKEEAYIEELHQLTLSVSRGREGFNHSPKTLLTDKKKNLMKRLSGSSKRRSLTSQSSVSSWEMDHQIMEEEESHETPVHPSIMEDKDNEEVFEEEPRKRKDSIPVITKRRKSIIRQQRVVENDKENVTPLLQDGVMAIDEGQNLDEHVMDDDKNLESNSKGSQVDPIHFSSYYLSPADSTAKTVKPFKLKGCDNNWSLESGKSLETVRHFPLKRNVALFTAASVSEKDLDTPKLQQDTPKYRLRRTSSLPDVLDSNKILDSEEQQIKATLDTLRKNVDCAMLAVIQTCKTQIDLQNRLSRSLSARYPLCSGGPSQFNLNYEENRQKLSSKSMRNLNSSFSSATGEPNISVDSLTGLSRETLEVTSHMKSSIGSVISHLEHYLADICPKYSSFDLSNTVGQMLWLSQHQSLLCSELERLSAGEPTGYSGSESLHPPPLCWTTNYPFSRSMPEYLNVHNSQALVTTSTLASIPSPPIYCSSFPSLNPLSPPVAFNSLGPAKTASFTPINSLSKQRVLRGQPSLSGSSCEGSFDIGGDSGAVGEWNEGKGSGVSSPYNWGQNLRTPDLVFGDFVAEKISQELEENISGKVSKITSEVSELGQKLDRNNEDVSEIKEKLTLILNRLNMVSNK